MLKPTPPPYGPSSVRVYNRGRNPVVIRVKAERGGLSHTATIPGFGYLDVERQTIYFNRETFETLRRNQVINYDDNQIVAANEIPINVTLGVGLIRGGELSFSGITLTLDIAAGVGILDSDPSEVEGPAKQVIWDDLKLDLPPDSDVYVFIKYDGIPGYSTIRDNENVILLGRVVTTSIGIDFIDPNPLVIQHFTSALDNYHRDALGAIYVSGSLVSAGGGRTLDVTPGEYYYAVNRFLPTGGVPITFTVFTRLGSSFSESHNQTVVDNTNYDLDGVLTPIPAGNWVKHSLYVVGGPGEEYFIVTAQETHNALTLAEQAPLPTPPSTFKDGVALIASVIVQQGNPDIVEIIDERPILGHKPSNVQAITYHSNLLGLDADDHLQYLNRNGIRPMTGTLDMGMQPIVNALEINGVTIPTQNVRTVKLNPGTSEFASIKDAVDSITTATHSNPFLVEVYPGVYNELPFVIPPYVNVVGYGHGTSIIQAVNPDAPLITINQAASIQAFEISGATGPNGVAIKFATTAIGTTAYLATLVFGANTTLISAEDLVFPGVVTCNFVAHFVAANFTTGIKISAQGTPISKSVYFILANPIFVSNVVGTQTFIDISGSAAQLDIENSSLNFFTNTTSTHIRVSDGARIVGSAVNLASGSIGIHAPNIGAAPSIMISGSNFSANDFDVLIEHPGTTGYADRPVSYNKISINPSSSFFIPDKDLNIITVSKRGGDFSSVASAIDAITTASESNRYLISVGPGIFTEPQIVLKPYVYISGVESASTVIEALDPTDHLIIASDNSGISRCTIRGATSPGKCLIYYSSLVGIRSDSFQVDDVIFGNADTLVIADGTIAWTTIFITNSVIGAQYSFNTGFVATTTGPTPGRVIVSDSHTNGMTAPLPADVFVVDGGELTVRALAIRTGGVGVGGNCIRVLNGGTVRCNGLDLEGFAVGILADNIGMGPRLFLSDLTMLSNTQNFVINHPDTTGSILATAEIGTSVFDPGTIGDLALILLNPTDGTLATSGAQTARQPDNTFCDTSTLTVQSSPMGLLSDGDINPPVSGFTVTVDAGVGYVLNSDGSLHKVEWDTTPIAIPADSNVYLYFDATATLSYNAARPDVIENIVLGRIVTDSIGILAVEESGFLSSHAANGLGRALRDGLGAVYASGSVASETGTRSLTITNGTYYFGERQFLTQGTSPATFISFYQDGVGGFNVLHGQTQVDNAFWDDGTGTLAPIAPGNYAKHTLYVLGDSTGDSDSEAYYVVYSQVQYTALTLAEQGPLPNPPNYLTDGITLISSIIVQQGVTNIVQIRDERPLFSAKRVSGVAASTFHSNLLGLTSGDDHPQYWRNDGTHLATGNFDLNSHAIVDVTTVNGVVVENHHLRHQPGGADAMLTGAGSQLTPDQAGAVGVSTNLSRADHIHNVPTAVAVGLSANSSNAQGSASTFSRADHVHFVASGVVSTQTPDQANAAGTSGNFARADHIHNIATAVPLTVGTANSQGSATSFSRSDHVHSHGNQTGPTQHAVATITANGFMSAADKIRIDTFTNKTGLVTAVSFTGTPKKYVVAFSVAYPSTDYVIIINGVDSRVWSYESKTAAGFTINSNSNQALTGEVSWIATPVGEL